MKKITIVTSIAAVAMGYVFYDLKKSTAEVDQVDGLYIFTDSKPATEYQVIGEVKLPMAYGKKKNHLNIKGSLIEKAKKAYPTAEGLIMDYSRPEDERGTVINFKD